MVVSENYAMILGASTDLQDNKNSTSALQGEKPELTPAEIWEFTLLNQTLSCNLNHPEARARDSIAVVFEGRVVSEGKLRFSGRGLVCDLVLDRLTASQVPITLEVRAQQDMIPVGKFVIRSSDELLTGVTDRIGAVSVSELQESRVIFDVWLSRFGGLPVELEFLLNGVRVDRSRTRVSEFQVDASGLRMHHTIAFSLPKQLSDSDRLTLVSLAGRRKIIFDRSAGGRKAAIGAGGSTGISNELEHRLARTEMAIKGLKDELAARTGQQIISSVNQRLELIHQLLNEKLEDSLAAFGLTKANAEITTITNQPAIVNVGLETLEAVGVLALEGDDEEQEYWLTRWSTLILRDAVSAQNLEFEVADGGPVELRGLCISVNGQAVEIEVITTAANSTKVVVSLQHLRIRAGETILLSLKFPEEAPVTAGSNIMVCCRLLGLTLVT